MRVPREKARSGEDPPMGKGPPDPQGADGRLAAGLLCGLVGTWLGVAATVPEAGLAVASGGLGHGDYLLARLLYPYTMILWGRSGATSPARSSPWPSPSSRPMAWRSGRPIPTSGLAGPWAPP